MQRKPCPKKKRNAMTQNDQTIRATVDLVILTSHKGSLYVLLSKRTKNPFADWYALPGKFIRTKESAEAEAKALLDEMLPGKTAYLEQLYTFTDPKRDTRGRIISIAYLAVIPWISLSATTLKEESCMELFRIDQTLMLLRRAEKDIHWEDLAFDHADIIRTGLVRLAGKIEYTDISFKFLNDQSSFAVSELKDIYDSILNKTSDQGNFRRMIKNRYITTGRFQELQVPRKSVGKGRPPAKYMITGN